MIEIVKYNHKGNCAFCGNQTLMICNTVKDEKYGYLYVCRKCSKVKTNTEELVKIFLPIYGYNSFILRKIKLFIEILEFGNNYEEKI